MIEEYKTNDRNNRKGAIVAQNYMKFTEKNMDYNEWVSDHFEPIANKSYYLYIYNSIINVFDSYIYNKIDYMNYKHLNFLYGYLDYLKSIKKLIYKYIGESIYSDK